jgi:hypothetical protein
MDKIMIKNMLILILLIQSNLFCQTNNQNKELKKIVKKTISHNKNEFKDQGIIYFEIPQYLKTTSSNETYSYKKEKKITICILNEKEVFVSEKIEFYYKINLVKEKTESIHVFRVMHPRVGVERKLIYTFRY